MTEAGEPFLPSNSTGTDKFEGDYLVSSSQVTEPKENANGKKAVTVDSDHDIAKDYYDHGYNITMV